MRDPSERHAHARRWRIFDDQLVQAPNNRAHDFDFGALWSEKRGNHRGLSTCADEGALEQRRSFQSANKLVEFFGLDGIAANGWIDAQLALLASPRKRRKCEALDAVSAEIAERKARLAELDKKQEMLERE